MTGIGRRGFLAGCGCCALGALTGSAFGAPWIPPGRFARPDEASDEGGLWALMDREETKLKRSAFLVRDKALNEYVSGIACRLAGDHCPDMRVYLVRTPLFNATMAPNGMMQVWSGLLLRVANEAQLAAVLGHEIGHYLSRHTLDRLRDVKSRAAFGQFLGIAFAAARLGTVGSLAQMGVLAGLFSYGRDQEREADRIGLDLMTRAGYDPAEASMVWSQLLEEIMGDAVSQEEYAERSVLFASHPPIEERQKVLAETARELARPEATNHGAEKYRMALAPFRTLFFEDELRRRKYGETLVLLARMQKTFATDGALEFYRGEVHRMRNEKDDLGQALSAYRQAASMAGAPPELYRSEGLVLRQLNQDAEAADAFRRYLRLKPSAEDAELVRTYVTKE
jgi:predicted Zn-dependent protease